MTQEDIDLRVKIDLLSNKIRDKVTKDKKTVTSADIQTYYDKNKARFAQPEKRDLNVVLTKTKAKANQAKAALAQRRQLEGGGQEVLDRPGLQGRRAAKLPGVQPGPAGEGVRHRRLQGRPRARSRGP